MKFFREGQTVKVNSSGFLRDVEATVMGQKVPGVYRVITDKCGTPLTVGEEYLEAVGPYRPTNRRVREYLRGERVCP